MNKKNRVKFVIIRVESIGQIKNVQTYPSGYYLVELDTRIVFFFFN